MVIIILQNLSICTDDQIFACHFRLTIGKRECGLTVSITHSVGLLMSSIQVFAQTGNQNPESVLVAQLVGRDTIRTDLFSDFQVTIITQF